MLYALVAIVVITLTGLTASAGIDASPDLRHANTIASPSHENAAYVSAALAFLLVANCILARKFKSQTAI